MNKEYEFLNQINFPSDLKKIPESKLQKVANELREEMIDAVSTLLGNKLLRAKIQHNARKLAETHFDWKQLVKKFENFYSQFI